MKRDTDHRDDSDLDGLEVVDLWDETGSFEERAPMPGSRPPTHLRWWIAGGVVALLAIVALALTRNDDSGNDSAESATTTTAVPTQADAVSQTLMGYLPPGDFAVVVDGELRIVDTEDNEALTASDVGAGNVWIGRRLGSDLVIGSGAQLNVFDLDGGVVHVPRSEHLLPSLSTSRWLRAREGFLFEAGDAAASGSYPDNVQPVASLRDGLLVRDVRGRLAIWNAGEGVGDAPGLPEVFGGAVVAAEPTRVAVANLDPAPRLDLVDLAAGSHVTAALAPGHLPRSGRFSPDGTRLALAVDSPAGPRALIIDTVSGHYISSSPRTVPVATTSGLEPFVEPLPFTWTEDGRVLMVIQGRATSESRLSRFRAVDGRFVGSIAGIGGLEQIESLD
jgi:hypothetical protein